MKFAKSVIEWKRCFLSPIGSAARVLVILEQFAGIAYLAVVVSRLIGMTIVHQKREIE